MVMKPYLLSNSKKNATNQALLQTRKKEKEMGMQRISFLFFSK
jgi:hypothetical protein